MFMLTSANRHTIFLTLAIVFYGCEEPQNVDVQANVYDGPTLIVKNVETYYSDSAIVKFKLTTNEQWEYPNGDRLFPNGLKIEFFEKKNFQPKAILLANSGKYTRSTEIYSVKGDVRIYSLDKEKQKLFTEELHWDPKQEKVYTDKFVKIDTEKETLTGTGLIATQDFKKYKILKPQGIFAHKTQ